MAKINILANFISQGWVVLMNIAFVPLYIKYIGMEGYGLIGIFTLLQAWSSLLDLGMTPALSREMSRFSSGKSSAESLRNLLRSVEIVTTLLALFIFFAVFSASTWLAADWVKPDTLQVDQIAQAFLIMGLLVALRFIEGIYKGALVGLQKQVIFNIAICIMATLRGVGSLAILVYVSPTIHAFLLWQAAVSVFTVFTFAAITYGHIPDTSLKSRFDIAELKRIWRFAGGMVGITLSSLLLMQVDKVLLSKQLSLAEYGNYAFAASVAGLLFALISPITQAVYPRLCELHAVGKTKPLIDIYHKSATLVSTLAGSVAIVIIIFSEELLRLWTRDPILSANTWQILSVLMLGNLLNAVAWIPYQTQLAFGWTSLAYRTNIIMVTIAVPLLLWTVPHYGAHGAAWVWACINLASILVHSEFMFRRILSSEKSKWHTEDLLLPLCAGAAAAICIKITALAYENVKSDFLILIFAFATTLLSSTLAASTTRTFLISMLRSITLAK